MIIRSHRSLCLVALTALPFFAGCDNDKAAKTETTTAVAPTAPTTPAQSAFEMQQKPAAQGAVDPNAWMGQLDPDMKEVLDQLGNMNGKPIETLSAADARKQPTPAQAVTMILKKEDKPSAPEKVGKTSDKTVDVGNGVKLPFRIYTPDGAKGPLPVVVYYHGGGWVIADNDVYDASARALTNAANAVVVAVDYRKGPENKFPAAHDDAIASYEWVLKNAGTIGGDAKKIALVGESAGGNLAANVAIAARDKKEQAPLALVLVYPVATADLNSPSELTYATAKPLNKPMMSWFTEQYFKSPADGTDPRINLAAADLKGLPPTTIINAQIDPLANDGIVLAAKMKAAGDTVEQKTFTGVTHEFFGMGAKVAKAKEAEQMAGAKLKMAFGGT